MFKTYSEYKQSLSRFGGNVPSHWTERRLSNVCSMKVVQNNSGEDLLSVFLNRGVVRYSDTSQRQVHKPSEDMSKYQLVEPGDLVLNNQQAWRGSVGVSKYRGIISPAYYVFRTILDINSSFMNYMVRDKGIVDQFVLSSKGVGSIQRTLYDPYLKNVIFALPPRTEQDQIVRFLDSKLSKITKLLNAKKKQITLLKEQKQAIINKAVTKGLDPNAKMKPSGVEWLGEIPAGWEWLMLSQVCSEQQIKNTDNTENKVLSLSYGKIVPKKNIDFGLVPLKYDGYQIVDEGNIILRLTDLQNDHKSLRTGLVKERGIITSAYTCLKPKHNSAYLQFLLHSFDIQKVFYGMGGGVRQSIGYDDIRSIQVPFPPRDEQEQIVSYIEQKSASIDKTISATEREIALIGEYRTRLISDAVTGKIDVRDVEVADFDVEQEEIENECFEEEDKISEEEEE